MNKIKYIQKTFLLGALLASLAFSSCVDDLNTTPIDETELDNEKAWRREATYLEFLAKNYAGLTLSGNKGPDGESDLNNGDQGVATFTRSLWNLQEVTTDEALCVWNDDGLKPLQFQQWTPENNYVYQFFQRAMLNVAFANEYLRETTDDKLSSRGMSHLQNDVHQYREEVRALRALNYYYMMDLYANPPFITENDGIGADVYPQQIKRADLFDWLETELKEIETNGVLPEKNYSRMSISSVRMLLARMYLNAKVYTGNAKYAEAATYSKKVIDSYPTLGGDYKNFFSADNHLRTDEIVFGLAFDKDYATSYGGTTFLIASALSAGDMKPASGFGLNSSWEGNRAPKELTSKFNNQDNRALFWKTDRSQEIEDWTIFKQGYSVTKFTNLKSTDVTFPNPDAAPTFADTDFPLFRLADAYLMYVEAQVRQSSTAGVDTYFNAVRTRAGISTLTAAQITLDEILDERLREFYWEAQRRTDLIRFDKYISGYNWIFKGGVKNGKDIDVKYKVFPIPSLELGANPNLDQNEGYTK